MNDGESFRPGFDEQVNVIGHYFQCDDFPAVLVGFEYDEFLAAVSDVADENLAICSTSGTNSRRDTRCPRPRPSQ